MRRGMGRSEKIKTGFYVEKWGMRRWSCLRDGLRRKEKIKETAEKDHSMNLPFTRQIQLRYRPFSIQHSIYRMSLCWARVTRGGNMKQDRCGNRSSERWQDLSEITHLESAGVTFTRNIPFVLRHGSKTLSSGPKWRRSFGPEEVKARPWLFWWWWWLPAQKTHPASKSLFWAVSLLLGTQGALELSNRASQGLF